MKCTMPWFLVYSEYGIYHSINFRTESALHIHRCKTHRNYSVLSERTQILESRTNPCLRLRKCESESHSVMSGSLRPQGLFSPWNSPGQNAGVGSRSLLQGNFPTQRFKPGLLHCRWDSLPAEPEGRWELVRSPITSWQIDEETMETVRLYFPGLQDHCGQWLQPWN